MKKNLWRIVVALILSSSCFMATAFLFGSSKSDSSRGLRTPMARLSDSNNEVQRKPIRRVIWESVNKNDELFPGEEVRTSPNSNARLFFMNSGTTVHLEADSLVVLEQNDKGPSLDFLQGNLFLQSAQGEPATDALTVKTGASEIKLNAADLSLSKKQNGDVDMEVYRGEAELNQGTKKTTVNSEKSVEISAGSARVSEERVQILRPLAGEVLYLNLSHAEKLDLKWKPLAAGYTVGVELGKARGQLQAVPALQTEPGTVTLTARPGHWYLRLVATSTDPKQPPISSPVVPFKIEPKTPPSLIEPRNEASILKPEHEAAVAFKWLTRHKFVSLVLELATDPQFKTTKLKQTLAGESTSFTTDLSDGSYFWRVTGFLELKGKTESLSSPIGKFNLVSKLDIQPPTLISPTNGQHLSFMDAKKAGVPLQWKLAPGIEQVKVKLERKNGETWDPTFDRDADADLMHIPDLTPGTYRWTISSVNPMGGDIKASAPFQFTIDDLAKVEWVQAAPEVEYEFATPTPSLKVEWKPFPAPSITYRYKILQEGSQAADWETTKQTLFDTTVAAEGRYEVVVEALNPKNQLLAQSESKMFVVKRKPLLPAPQWASGTPEVLHTDSKGNLTLGWEQVEGAHNYLMILETQDGTVVQEQEVSRNTASISRLKPGQYQVHLKSIDNSKRSSIAGDKRKLEVPVPLEIHAPKIKAVKVK